MLDRVLESYFRVKGFEKDGIFFRLTGIQKLYEAVARLFNEEPLGPPSRLSSLENLHFGHADFERMLMASRYYDLANVCKALLYLPAVIAAFVLGVPLAAGWGATLLTMHYLMVSIERYKRVLCVVYLPLVPPDYVPVPRVVRPPREASAFANFFFGPWRWESAKLYRALGVEVMQRFVQFCANLTRVEAKNRVEGEKFRFIDQAKRQSLTEFLGSTRTSEGIHLIALGLNLPLLIPFIMSGHKGWSVYVGFIILFDLYCVFLQRYNRVRMHRIRRVKEKLT